MRAIDSSYLLHLSVPLGNWSRTTLCAVSLAVLQASAAAAVTYIVDSDGDGNTTANSCSTTSTGSCTLRAAVGVANAGDVLEFAPGNYRTINVGSELVIDHALTIIGLPDEGIRLNGGGNNRIFRANSSGVVLRDLVLENGFNNDRGGAILIHLSGLVQFENVVFRDNSVNAPVGGGGGAIAAVSSGRMNCIECVFEGNEAVGGASGGAYFHTSNRLTLILRSAFSENISSDHGGAIHAEGQVSVYNSSFLGNRSANVGGAAHAEAGGFLTVSMSSFAHNVRPGGIARGASIATGGELSVEAPATVLAVGSIVQALEQSGVSACAAPSGVLEFDYMLSNDPSCVDPTDSLPVQATGLSPHWVAGDSPTPYLRPLSSSPAIDGFNATFPCTAILLNNLDQRGRPRAHPPDDDGNARCDLGAFEAQWFFADGFESGDTTGWTSAVP